MFLVCWREGDWDVLPLTSRPIAPPTSLRPSLQPSSLTLRRGYDYLRVWLTEDERDILYFMRKMPETHKWTVEKIQLEQIRLDTVEITMTEALDRYVEKPLSACYL